MLKIYIKKLKIKTTPSCTEKRDKASIVMNKDPYDVIQNRKITKKSLVQLFRYFFPYLKHKQINLKYFFGYFFPFQNDVISNLIHDNIGFTPKKLGRYEEDNDGIRIRDKKYALRIVTYWHFKQQNIFATKKIPLTC